MMMKLISWPPLQALFSREKSCRSSRLNPSSMFLVLGMYQSCHYLKFCLISLVCSQISIAAVLCHCVSVEDADFALLLRMLCCFYSYSTFTLRLHRLVLPANKCNQLETAQCPELSQVLVRLLFSAI